jgi:hypothetical protein
VGAYIAICTMGVPAETRKALQMALAEYRFFFDTDVVISYLLEHENNHSAARAIFGMIKRLGGVVVVPRAVVEEVARHAAKAHVDYREQVQAGLPPRTGYELYELQSAFTREFEYMRGLDKVRSSGWTNYIESFTGPMKIGGGRLEPDIDRMAKILTRERFEIVATDTSAPDFDQKVQRLTHALQLEWNARSGREDEGVDFSRPDKCRIDAELLLAVEKAASDERARVKPFRWFLISSSNYLRRLSRTALTHLNNRPDVLRPGQAAFFASLVPDVPVSTASLASIIFDDAFRGTLMPVDSMLLRVLRNTAGVTVLPAMRGAIIQSFSDALVHEAKQRGVTRKEMRRAVMRDPVRFGELAIAAANAHGLVDPAEKERVLERIREHFPEVQK